MIEANKAELQQLPKEVGGVETGSTKKNRVTSLTKEIKQFDNPSGIGALRLINGKGNRAILGYRLYFPNHEVYSIPIEIWRLVKKDLTKNIKLTNKDSVSASLRPFDEPDNPIGRTPAEHTYCYFQSTIVDNTVTATEVVKKWCAIKNSDNNEEDIRKEKTGGGGNMGSSISLLGKGNGGSIAFTIPSNTIGNTRENKETKIQDSRKNQGIIKTTTPPVTTNKQTNNETIDSFANRPNNNKEGQVRMGKHNSNTGCPIVDNPENVVVTQGMLDVIHASTTSTTKAVLSIFDRLEKLEEILSKDITYSNVTTNPQIQNETIDSLVKVITSLESRIEQLEENIEEQFTGFKGEVEEAIETIDSLEVSVGEIKNMLSMVLAKWSNGEITYMPKALAEIIRSAYEQDSETRPRNYQKLLQSRLEEPDIKPIKDKWINEINIGKTKKIDITPSTTTLSRWYRNFIKDNNIQYT